MSDNEQIQKNISRLIAQELKVQIWQTERNIRSRSVSCIRVRMFS